MLNRLGYLTTQWYFLILVFMCIDGSKGGRGDMRDARPHPAPPPRASKFFRFQAGFWGKFGQNRMLAPPPMWSYLAKSN